MEVERQHAADFCIQNTTSNGNNPIGLSFTPAEFAYKIAHMAAEIISIPRSALHEQAATRLRQMLLEGHIAPGAKLNERELSEVLKVSRTPLREAIKMLAAEGIVELVPHRGAIAVSLSEEDVMHTFEVMAGLEGLSGELAAQRVTDEELAEMKAMHYEMLAAYTRADLPGYYRVNMKIHHAINAAAKNPVLAATYRQVNARVQGLRFRSNQDGAKWKRAVKEHEKMIDALAAHDGAALKEVLVAHLLNKRDVVIAQMREAAAGKTRKAR
jgi:DNA-binding GntR family transcriptional regulator